MSDIRTNILRTVSTARDLPTLPTVMSKIHLLVNDPNSSAAQLVEVLENDPAISTRILKTVNSVIYATAAGQVTDLRQAVMRLGFREVENIALSTSVFKAMANLPERIFNRREFWRHSICTSFVAVELAATCPKGRTMGADVLHLAGLIHDLGKMLLEAYFPEEFEACVNLAMQQSIPLPRAEHALLRIDHAEIGGVLAKRWNLPPEPSSVIRWHHHPTSAPGPHRDLVRVVHLANYITNTQDLGTGGDIARPVFDPDTWETLGIPATVVPDLVQKTLDNESSLLEIIQ